MQDSTCGKEEETAQRSWYTLSWMLLPILLPGHLSRKASPGIHTCHYSPGSGAENRQDNEKRSSQGRQRKCNGIAMARVQRVDVLASFIST